MGELEAKLVEAVLEAALEKPCLTNECRTFLEFGKSGLGFRMPREQTRLQAEIQRQGMRRIFQARRKNARRIRAMIGPGEFLYDKTDKDHVGDGHITATVIDAELQPHTPAEHDMFVAIVKHYSGKLSASIALSMDGGNLSLKFAIPMPQLEAVQVDGRAGIALKADKDFERAQAARAVDDAAKAKEAEAKQLADDAAKAKKISDDDLINAAARAGAEAAKDVLEDSKK